jgi:hypothetical protein
LHLGRIMGFGRTRGPRTFGHSPCGGNSSAPCPRPRAAPAPRPLAAAGSTQADRPDCRVPWPLRGHGLVEEPLRPRGRPKAWVWGPALSGRVGNLTSPQAPRLHGASRPPRVRGASVPAQEAEGLGTLGALWPARDSGRRRNAGGLPACRAQQQLRGTRHRRHPALSRVPAPLSRHSRNFLLFTDLSTHEKAAAGDHTGVSSPREAQVRPKKAHMRSI